MGATNTYEITIKTSDELYAGTDSNIFVSLYGYKGVSSEYRLNGMISGNAFERNDTNKVTLKDIEDVGDIYMLALRSDCMYAGSDWRVDDIKVRNGNTKNTSQFLIKDWIKDKNTHTYYDVALPIDDNMQVQEANAYSDAFYSVPANAEVCKTDEKTFTIGYSISESNAFELDASGEYSKRKEVKLTTEEAQSVLKFVLAIKLKKEDSKKIETTTTITSKQEVKFPVCDTEKKYRFVYAIRKELHTIRLGNLTLEVPNISSISPAGFEDVK